MSHTLNHLFREDLVTSGMYDIVLLPEAAWSSRWLGAKWRIVRILRNPFANKAARCLELSRFAIYQSHNNGDPSCMVSVLHTLPVTALLCSRTHMFAPRLSSVESNPVEVRTSFRNGRGMTSTTRGPCEPCKHDAASTIRLNGRHGDAVTSNSIDQKKFIKHAITASSNIKISSVTTPGCAMSENAKPDYDCISVYRCL